MATSATKAPKEFWGRWQFMAEERELWYQQNLMYSYCINLDECTTPDKVLACIQHVSKKPWCSMNDLANLCFALRDILEPPSSLSTVRDWGKLFDSLYFVEETHAHV